MSKIDARAVQGAIAQRGFNICIGLPAALLAIALLARANLEFLETPVTGAENLKIAGFALITVALAVLAFVFLRKRSILKSEKLIAEIRSHPANIAEILSNQLYPLFFIAAIPAAIGLIFYFLGGDLDTYVLISVFCPAGLMILKPRESEIEQLESELPGSED
ncbi:MAG: hypothetical protein IPH59_05485 [bacterium]|nr:hypothetical protein [bacterium]